MKLRRIKAMAVKEVLQIWRDPRSLMVAMLLPFTQMFLLGYGVTLDLKHIPICTFDREASQQSQDLLKLFASSQYFSIARNVRGYPEIVAGLDSGDCKLAIVIPPDFTERLADSSVSSVQAILDGTDDNTANISLGYALSVVNGYSNAVNLDWLDRQGRELQQIVPMVTQSRVWFNEDLESRNFVIPGLVAVIMALVGAQLTSLTISREWERGTMELLVSTPVTPGELMIGKLAPYIALGWVDAASCLLIAAYWFGVPYRGTILALFATTTLFLVVVLGIGYLLSVLIRSQIGASQVALLVTMLPTTLLSGYVFPIDQMPVLVQKITYLVYSRYYVTIVKALFLKGSSLIALSTPILCLLVYATAVMVLAARAFRKELA
ncbi:ABC transporter permease [Bradyrhizobium sp.]|uniref:ABC transporter permease n=1 Tax=Bradyrhizobium sp. TaxID=376 RepID=UPI003C3C720B